MQADFVSLKNRKDHDWSDITPLPQYEGHFPVLNIKYPPEYDEVLGYFRAVCHKEEISRRVYDLTAEVINYIPGSYTAWDTRKRCIEKLNLDLKADQDFCTKVLDKGNEKCFQLWEHRRWLLGKIGNANGEALQELNVLDKHVFSHDNKNYHGWIYRKWIVETFELYDKDFPKIENFIEEDVGNNSAWNFRYFIKSREIKDKEPLKKELEYVFDKIKEDPDNEASWNYLNGWFKQYSYKCFKQGGKDINVPTHLIRFNYAEFPNVQQFTLQILKEHEDCRFAYATLLQIHLMSDDKSSIQKALDIVDILATTHDKTRFIYWLWVQKNIRADFDVPEDK